jgi:putative ABC transport system permease protein
VFTERDLAALAELGGVEAVVPVGPVATSALTHEGDTVSRGDGVIATAPTYLENARFREGRAFEPGQAEAVLNPAASELFAAPVGVGDSLSVTLASGQRRTVTVTGVLNGSESLSPFEGFGSAPRVYVPTDPFYTTTLELPDGEQSTVYSLFVLEATGVGAVDEATANARAYLEEESDARTLLAADAVFRLQTSAELLDQLREILDIFTGFVTGIAVISLVVAAIGIGNIMLVSVTERTREIGIMKAVGAQRRDVLGLFLAESMVLGLVGAVLGIVTGVAAAYAATSYVGIPVRFDYTWIAVAVGVGVLVGVVAGLYPAWRAARTDPIEALRYE